MTRPARHTAPAAAGRLRQPRVHPDRGLHLRQGDVVLRLRLDRGGGLQRGLLTSIATPATRGQMVAAYTAQFGNGVSAHISARTEPRTRQRRSRATPAVAAVTIGSNVGVLPTRTWTGSVRLRTSSPTSASIRPGVLPRSWARSHDVSAAYYGNGRWRRCTTECNGHPSDKWGWAVSAGLRINFPMIGPGRLLPGPGRSTPKARRRYASNTPRRQLLAQRWNGEQRSASASVQTRTGYHRHALAAPGGHHELTTAWSVFASYEHFWTPSLRTSLVRVVRGRLALQRVCNIALCCSHATR